MLFEGVLYRIAVLVLRLLSDVVQRPTGFWVLFTAWLPGVIRSPAVWDFFWFQDLLGMLGLVRLSWVS